MPPKKKKVSLPVAIESVGVLQDNVLRVTSGVTEVHVGTPGMIGKLVGCRRQYVDILIRRTEEAHGLEAGALSVHEIILPPSTKERRIFLSADHYRLLVQETIEFPKNGKFAKTIPAGKPKAKAAPALRRKLVFPHNRQN